MGERKWTKFVRENRRGIVRTVAAKGSAHIDDTLDIMRGGWV